MTRIEQITLAALILIGTLAYVGFNSARAEGGVFIGQFASGLS